MDLSQSDGMRVALVSCGAEKLAGEHPARELYVSTLFQFSRDWAERYCDRWYILSALHGLVTPDRLIRAYDVSLQEFDACSRWQWARGVAGALNRHNAGAELVVLAGATYTRPLSEFLTFDEPLKGLGIGERLGWLKRELEAVAS